jgi:hypothetical protein
MFEIQPKYIVDTDIPIIVDNYLLIHFDEVPILYTGTNEYGDRIIGSLCAESEDGETFRYFQTIIKNIDFVKFKKNKISYRQLIETAKRIFVIDKDVNEKIINIYNTPIAEIPQDCMPLASVFCPHSEVIFGSEFTLSLKGQLADAHEALNNQVNIISKNVMQFLTTITDCVKVSGLTPEIHQVAYTPTSFGINFRVKFTSNDLYFNKEAEKALNEYVTKTIDYSINHLSSEARKLKDKDFNDTEFQKMVNVPLENAYQILAHKFDAKSQERLVNNIMKIPFELERMTDQLGHGFEYLEMKSHNTTDKQESSIGVMDNDFYNKLVSATEIIESKENIVTDDVFKNYEIHVYHLNILTRKGNAHIKNKGEDDKEILDSPKIDITGEAGLDGSEFIGSMDKGSWITVRAKAKRVNGRYKTLTIEYK